MLQSVGLFLLSGHLVSGVVNLERLQASHHGYADHIISVVGVWGQDCTPDSGDFPSKCKTIGDRHTSSHGKIECFHNFDCCTCGEMICGPDCAQLNCNGDSGCYGVKNIQMRGGEAGADIICNGDLSCMETAILGTRISGILCTGDGACAYSSFHLGCIGGIEGGCTLRCVGDNSCQGDPAIPKLASSFVISNSSGLVCASHACRYGYFNLLQNLGGGVTCGAERACTGAMITINNIESLSCGGIYSCLDAHILILNPQNGFYVDCMSRESCANLNLEIIVTDPEITEFFGVSCGGPSSCDHMVMSISKILPKGSKGPKELNAGSLECGAAGACKNTVFDLGENVFFDSCTCGVAKACEGLLGVDSCTQGLGKMECVGATGCANMEEHIVNPSEHFELICSDPGSCENFILTIYITDVPQAPATMGGITCGAPGACTGLRVFVLNFGPSRVTMGGAICGGVDSCKGAAFVMRGCDMAAITCGDATSCGECGTWTDNQYVACEDTV